MNRETATRQIERIIQAIEAENFPAKVLELHVFGSFARGALNPGDLDLIVIHEPAPDLLNRLEKDVIKKYGKSFLHWPPRQWPHEKFKSMMAAVMRKPGEKMDILLAESMEKIDEIGENIANTHRVLIWSNSDRDWQAKLDAIKPDPQAGRHERAHFADLKRFNTDLQTMEHVTEAVSQGYLKLTQLDADKVEPTLNPGYQHCHDWWMECGFMGKKSLKLLRYGMWWIQEQPGQADKCPDHPRREGDMFSKDGKYVVCLGNPPLHVVFHVARGEPRRKGICLIPHFKRGELNEMFVFEKGERTDQKELGKIERGF